MCSSLVSPCLHLRLRLRQGLFPQNKHGEIEMVHHATVYLTGKEAEILEEFCKVNGCTKSQALKYGVMQLGASAGHGSGKHNGNGFFVTQEQLKQWVDASRAEKERKRQKEIEEQPFKEASERAEKISKEVFK